MELHEYVCDLCDAKKNHDPIDGHVPVNWKMKQIHEQILLICSRCNNPGHWNGGMSPALEQLYKKKFG